ncbi:conserved Plasmodium protein, unknown function [Plasmodium gallinaceum]|uniref:Rad50/SbcC-type AAA domain-containing protein n=1 Tax=Plasmodium gallinaceum TaxID=5849 RepID=A0A1J1GLD9_PLAGA|nr:conserved Plasmodium protein, unknown function [Plasmodium gallinaceum]CRG93021.1 conserved Plasmodium protein, unknown function [Plasmodium gallinaceum]
MNNSKISSINPLHNNAIEKDGYFDNADISKNKKRKRSENNNEKKNKEEYLIEKNNLNANVSEGNKSKTNIKKSVIIAHNSDNHKKKLSSDSDDVKTKSKNTSNSGRQKKKNKISKILEQKNTETNDHMENQNDLVSVNNDIEDTIILNNINNVEENICNEIINEEIENNYCDINMLNDVDLKSFYGSTGKIIKLRIRNFLNHENLELTFNSYKNIIIGKNGKGKSAIAQAVAVALGSQGKYAGRDINLANYIKDYDKNKKNLVCYIEIFLSNSGKNSFKRDIYGDVIIIKRVVSSHTSKFYLYGLSEKKNYNNNKDILTNLNKGENNNINNDKEKKNKYVCKKSYIDNYLNFIKLNIRSPCVYLDQEKGKQFFSNINEKALHKFFMNSVGLNIVEEEIEKESELLENCLNQIKQKQLLLSPQEEELKAYKERNNILKNEFDKLSLLDNNYKVLIFYESLKNTIILFNEYLKSENFKNEKVINNIQSKMNTLVEESENLKLNIKRVIEKDTTTYNLIKKEMDKITKYDEMIKELNDLKTKYIDRRQEIINYISSFEKAKDNKKLLQEYLNKYEEESEKLNEKMTKEMQKEIELQNEINIKENSIYEMEYLISKNKNTVDILNKQINDIIVQSNKVHKIKNNEIKKKIYIYGYDIYSLRNNIIKNYSISIKSENNLIFHEELKLINKNQKNNFTSKKNTEFSFTYAPIGPVGEYIKLKKNVENIKILSIIEKHLGDIFYSWLVSCYEDKNKLNNIEIENKNKFNIIVTNAFQHVNRDKLMKNIQLLLDKIHGNTIYSFLNIDLLPTSLLFYLYDNFRIVQTLICNNSSELHELLRLNDKSIIKSIYVIDDFVLVKVLSNGSLHFLPSKEEYYRDPLFLNLLNEENKLIKNKKNSEIYNNSEDDKNNVLDSEIKTNEQKIKELEKSKKEKNEEILKVSKKLLSYKNILDNLNDSIKKSKFLQDELKYQLKNIDELKANHDNIFMEQMDIEIKEKNKDINDIENYLNDIETYIKVLEEKKENSYSTTSIHKCLISSHIGYLQNKKEKFSFLIKEYQDLKEILIKLEMDKQKNDEISNKNKKNFLLSLNKLHNIYFECINNNFSLDDIFLKNPFLILKNKSENKAITNITLQKSMETQIENINDYYNKSNNENKNDLMQEVTIKLIFTTQSTNDFSECTDENISVEIPMSSLNSFNKLFVLSENDESTVVNKEESYKKSSYLNDNKEYDIKDLRKLEKYIQQILSSIISTNNNLLDKHVNNSNFDEFRLDSTCEKYSETLWKKRCEKKKEIIEILKMSGFNENDNTDNSMRSYFNNLIEQYINDEKSYNKQLKQISDLKNNYDMHLSNIKLRKAKYSFILGKTKEQITIHFKNILKNMNNYKGKLEFDDTNRNLKVMVSINQDISNNIFMEMNSLSGGEKSTIQMALLASFSLTETSSFHIFDELDVYMDELTRVKNMKLFCDFVKINNDKQYFFITPHIEITELFLDDAKNKKAKILSLS